MESTRYDRSLPAVESASATALTLLRLLQFADSSFPTGGFAFSNGLEGLAHLGFVRNEAEIRSIIRAQIEEGLGGIDLPAVFHAHGHALDGAITALVQLDLILTALKPVAVFRAASLTVGRRFLESAAALFDDPVIRSYRAAIPRQRDIGHYATAWGAVCARAGIEADAAALGYGAIALQGQTAAAIRLGLIGHAAAQRIATALQPALITAVGQAATLGLDDMGAYQPLLDIAGLRQPALDTRLFAS